MSSSFNELSIELTKKCVLGCIYCSSGAGIDKVEELEFGRLLEIIGEVKKFGVTTVSLSGGESFLYTKFLELFNYLKKNRINIIIYTSGITVENGENKPLSKSILKQLKIDKENPKILVNIQGHNKDTIEKINGIPNSYKIIKESIKNIQDENIYIGSNVVPFKSNFKNIEKIYNFCLKNNFNQINFLRFVPQGRGRTCDLNLNPSEFMEVQKTLIKILKRNKDKKAIDIRIGHPINFLFLLDKRHLYKKDGPHYCRGGSDAPLILPNGDVAMCPAWKDLTQFNAGNIYHQNFTEIWTSHNFYSFRKFLNDSYKEALTTPCKDCIYLKECRGKCVAQRLLAQGDELKKCSLEEIISCAPDPQCFKNLI